MGNKQQTLNPLARRRTGTDPRDEHTPDEWIKSRDPLLDRLTGNHPLNAELPLTFVAANFLTPPARGYVRNHGAVPHLSASTHRLEIKGLGFSGASVVLDMEEIMHAFPTHDVTISFCCSGNRRKEVNAVKPSIGVPFGVGAIQTGTFRGVYLHELLRHCNFDREAALWECAAEQGREHACCFINFAGPETELPRGDYGTSLLLDYVLDPANDVMVAYEFNGAPLLPDHGFPLRLIIPGFIGGRMVKWLKTIEVSSKESSSHYYYHDNRFFPGGIVTGMEEATQGKWWYKPELIIGEMNLNSAITEPDHGDIIVTEGDEAHDRIVEIKGFAYTGGGRRVVIVELSFDGGTTWEPAEFIPHPLDKPSCAGKWWTWRLWRFVVPLTRLATGHNGGDDYGPGLRHADEHWHQQQQHHADDREQRHCPSVKVRAWDTSFNTQPERIAWNVLGMMNNSIYTVRCDTCRSRDGRAALIFSHPQPPHEINFDKDFGRPPCEVEERGRPQVKPAPTAGIKGRFTKAQVAQHNKEDDLWLIVNGQVYDVTTFLNDHPGGSGIITINGGDVCQEFDDIHSPHAHKLLKEYHMGELTEKEEEKKKEGVGVHEIAEEEKEKEKPTAAAAAFPTPEEQGFLDPHNFKFCPLIQKDTVSHDTKRFRFGLSHPNQLLGLPLGHHLYLRAMIHGEMIMRPYTPTSLSDQRGSFELVVKVYHAHEDLKHPAGGKMSQYLDQMHIGDTIDVKGPMGRLVYHGRGWFSIGDRTLHASRVGMLAGGTGITPMYQIIQAIMRDEYDETQVALIFANKTPEDILMRPELDSLALKMQAAEGKLHVWYTVDRLPLEHGPESWHYGIGHVDADMIAAHLPPPSPETLMLMCGPPPFVHYACEPNLEKLGHETENRFVF